MNLCLNPVPGIHIVDSVNIKIAAVENFTPTC